MPGIQVLFSPVGGGTLLPRDGFVITDNRGIAELGEWQLSTKAGTTELWVVVAGRRLLSFTAHGLPGDPAVITGSQPPDFALPGMTMKLTVSIADRFGNSLDAVPVTFSVLAGSGSLSRTEATTDTLGRAETEWTVGSPGENTVSASGVDLATRFSITAIDTAGSTFFDLVSIDDNYNSHNVGRSWISMDAAGHFFNFIEFRSGGKTLLGGGYRITAREQTLFNVVLEGHLGCEEYGVLDGNALYLERYPFLDCDDEWGTDRWTYQRRPLPVPPPR